MTYTNTEEIDLLVWETNPSKRNVNNQVKFYIKSELPLQVGDKLKTKFDRTSTYEVTEIQERRKGSIQGKDYVVALTKWYIQ